MRQGGAWNLAETTPPKVVTPSATPVATPVATPAAITSCRVAAPALAAAPPMPPPPAPTVVEDDETVQSETESDLDLDLECSVCAEAFDVSTRTPMVLPCSGSHEICAVCVVGLCERFGGDDRAFQCPSCRDPILPCFPINKNRGLVAALILVSHLGTGAVAAF